MRARQPWSARDIALALASLFLLPATALALRLWGLQPVRRALGPAGGPSASGRRTDNTGSAAAARSVARAVALADLALAKSVNCLARSVLLEALLARRGIQGVLRIGARRVGATVDAHAWVEHDGQPLNDTADVAQRYSAFEALPTAPRRLAS